MANYTRNDLTGVLSPVNAELEKIEQSLQDKLDREPASGQSNELKKDLDANGKRIYNLPAPQDPNDAARLKDVQDAVSGDSPYPPQDGLSGYRLTTDGSNVFWDNPALDEPSNPVQTLLDAKPTVYATTAAMEASEPEVDGLRAINTQRGGASYVLSTTATAQAGDITTANFNVWVLQDLDNFRAYGDVDDATDCGALIQSVLNSGRSNIYKFRGNFTVDTPSEINGISDLTIDCYGAYFDCSNMYGDDIGNNPDALFKIFGSEYGATTLSVAASKNDTTLTVADGTQIKEGSEIYILSDQHWYTETVSIGRRFIATVQDVTGNVVTIEQPLPFDFDVSGYTVDVESWDQVQNIKVLGGRFYGGNYRRDLGNGKGIGVVFAQYFKNLQIKDFYVDGFENTAFRPQYGKDCTIADGFIQGHADTFGTVTEGVNSGFYGVFFSRVLSGIMRNVTGVRNRHLQDSSSCFDLTVCDCKAYKCHRPAYGCHSGTADTTYINNFTRNPDNGGIQWRGWHLYCDNNKIFVGNGSTNGIYDSAGGASDLPSVRVLTNNHIEAGRDGINIAGTTSLVQIKGGTVTGGLEGSSYNAVNISSQYIENVDISGDFEQGSGAGIVIRQSSSSASTMKMFKVTGSTLRSDTNLVRIFAPASTGAVWIENNVFDSSAATYDISINNAQVFEQVANNYRPDGTAATRNP